ncbi:MAG TPA: cation diffusion facilitator family transporter [Casimicrobiaceae bacterium]|nr:cation diffusion facilitator family transporter [Casimicrobiaceae bacterium]
MHSHDHGGHEHGHGHGARAARDESWRALWIALVLTAGYAVVELIGGVLAHSLALISDAGHMATDAAAFVVALIATAVARRPPSQRASYGYARAEVLAAFINALAMLALILWIAVEAVARLLTPAPVSGGAVIGVAATGLVINIVVAWLLARAGGGMNTRGALLHVLGDLLGSVAAVTAGAVIYFTGWYPIDPILSLGVALLILRSTWDLLKQSTVVLMEQVPPHLSFDDIGRELAHVPNVLQVHDLHVWHMSADRVALSAHLNLADGNAWPATLAAAQAMLARKFGIEHVTLQPSWPPAADGRRVIPLTALDDRS